MSAQQTIARTPSPGADTASPVEVAAWIRRVLAGPRPEVDPVTARQLLNLSPAEVTETAERHRVAPWIVAALRPHAALLQGEAWEGLQRIARRQTDRTLAHYVELLGLLEACRERSIEVVILKGASIAHEWYPDPTLRPYGDVDLLVRERDEAGLVEELASRGYLEKPRSDEGHSHDDHGHFQRIFMHPRTRQIIEVHVDHLQIGLRPVGMQELWQSVRWLKFHHATAGTLEVHDLFVHLAVHLHRHGFERLIWFKDLDLIARSGALDWRRVRRLAEREGCKDSLATALEFLEATLDTPLPEEARSLRAERSVIARWLFPSVWKAEDVVNLAPRRRWRLRRVVQFAPETGLVRGGLGAFLGTGRRTDKLRILASMAMRRVLRRS